jgi:hypothetical protein
MDTNLQETLRLRREQKAAVEKARTAKIRASTNYCAIVNIDFTRQDKTEYQRLIAALIEIGWKYVETSALAFEGELPNILVGMELITKQCQTAGILSALTFHIQGSTEFKGKPYPQSKSYPQAFNEIRKKPLPNVQSCKPSKLP